MSPSEPDVFFIAAYRRTALRLCALGALCTGLGITTFLILPDDKPQLQRNSQLIQHLSKNNERLRAEILPFGQSVTTLRKTIESSHRPNQIGLPTALAAAPKQLKRKSDMTQIEVVSERLATMESQVSASEVNRAMETHAVSSLAANLNTLKSSENPRANSVAEAPVYNAVFEVGHWE